MVRKFVFVNPQTGETKKFATIKKLRRFSERFGKEQDLSTRQRKELRKAVFRQTGQFRKRSLAKRAAAEKRLFEGLDVPTRDQATVQTTTVPEPQFVDPLGQGISIAPSVARAQIAKFEEAQRQDVTRQFVDPKAALPIPTREITVEKRILKERPELETSLERRARKLKERDVKFAEAEIFKRIEDVASTVTLSGRAKGQRIPREERSVFGQIAQSTTEAILGGGLALGGQFFSISEKGRIAKESLQETLAQKIAGRDVTLSPFFSEFQRAGIETAKTFDIRTTEGQVTFGTAATLAFIPAIPKAFRGRVPSVRTVKPKPTPTVEFKGFTKPVTRFVPTVVEDIALRRGGVAEATLKTVKVKELPPGFDVVDVRAAQRAPKGFDPFIQTLPERQLTFGRPVVDPILQFERPIPKPTATIELGRAVGQRELGQFGLSRELALQSRAIEQARAFGTLEAGRTGTFRRAPSIQTRISDFGRVQEQAPARQLQFTFKTPEVNLFKSKRGQVGGIKLVRRQVSVKLPSRFGFKPFELDQTTFKRFVPRTSEVARPTLGFGLKPAILGGFAADVGTVSTIQLADVQRQELFPATGLFFQTDIIQRQALTTDQAISLITEQAPAQAVSQATQFDTLLSPVQVTRPAALQEPITQLQQPLERPTERPRERKIRRRPRAGLDFERDDTVQGMIKQKVQGYDVLVRDMGKDLRANIQKLPKKEAFRLLKDVLENSLSASGRVVKAGKKKVPVTRRSKLAQGGEVSNRKFRRGKTQKTRNSIVEKRSFRLNSFGEIQGITAAKLLQRRKKQSGLKL